MPAIADPMKSEPFERERKQIEEKKGDEKSKSSSCTQVEYGSTDLSQKAINYRKDNNIKGTRNVAFLNMTTKMKTSTMTITLKKKNSKSTLSLI